MNILYLVFKSSPFEQFLASLFLFRNHNIYKNHTIFECQHKENRE